jgi:exopolyphosphatase/guanosine-5'-triphosphate,3'-diphosphate pyrophosphatase
MRHYNPEKINGTRLTRKRVANLANKLYRLRAKEREEITGLERGREYLIVPGLIIAEEAMDVFSANDTVVSDGSLLEGIINAMQTGKIKGDAYEEPKL